MWISGSYQAGSDFSVYLVRLRVSEKPMPTAKLSKDETKLRKFHTNPSLAALSLGALQGSFKLQELVLDREKPLKFEIWSWNAGKPLSAVPDRKSDYEGYKRSSDI